MVALQPSGARRFELDDLMDLVREVRAAQVGAASCSFVAQRGTYLGRRGAVADREPGAQIFIIDVDQPPQRFERSMVALAEEIARRTAQPEVVVQLQRNGLSEKIMGISAD